MPIDPSIPLSVRPAPTFNPLEVMGQVVALQEVRERGEARRQAAEEARAKRNLQAQIAQAYQQSVSFDEQTGKPSVNWKTFWSMAPAEAIPGMMTELQSAEANQLDIDTKTLALNTAREQYLGHTGQTILAANGSPSLWQNRLLAARRLKAIDEPTYQAFSQITDPKNILDAAQAFVQNAGGELVKPQLVEMVDDQGQTIKKWVIPKVGESYRQGAGDVSYQDVEMLLDGTPQRVGFNPKTNTYHFRGQDVTARVKPAPHVVDPTLAAIRDLQLAQLQAGQSPAQVATFNQISGQYQRSPLINARDRTIVLEDAVKAVRRNPKDAAAQLQLGYAYIQALDTYQSAVREGELQNVGVIGTKWQTLLAEVNRYVSTGSFMPPEVAKQIADNSDQLVKTIAMGARRKRQEFAARARASGVGAMWEQFEAGMPQDPAAPTPEGTAPGGGPVRVRPPAAAGSSPAPGANPFRK